jgi:hypothetical protein
MNVTLLKSMTSGLSLSAAAKRAATSSLRVTVIFTLKFHDVRLEGFCPVRSIHGGLLS